MGATPTAALYVRKSTDAERGASGDSLSIERQIEQGRRFAEARGWTVSRVYKDDAVSGQEYVNRPGYLEMMNALGTFTHLIVMEQSRLGRDTARALLAVETIEEAGVEIWSYRGERISVAEEGDEMRATLNGLIDTQEARRASKRTREKMYEAARAGRWTGGPIFGYTLKREQSYSDLVVNEAEAAVVRQIFQWSADGLGIHRIARRLNLERPGARKWSAQSVRDMLVNEAYAGRLVFGASLTVGRKGQRVRVAQPDPSKIVRVERPEWRIVPESLWQAVQARKAATFTTYVRRPDGRLTGKPEGGVLASRYLLSGMLTCDHCNGAMVIWSHAGRDPRYVCSVHRGRGPTACENKWSIAADEVHAVVVLGLQDEILTPARLEQLARDLAADAVGSPERVAAERASLEGQLAAVRKKLARLTEAVAEGGPLTTLVAAIKAGEREDADLRVRLAQIDAVQDRAAAWSDPSYVAKVERLLERWHEALEGSPLAARQVLRKVLTGPVRVRHRVDGAWDVVAVGIFGPILASVGTAAYDMIVKVRDRRVPRPVVALGDELRALVAEQAGDSTGWGQAEGTPDVTGAQGDRCTPGAFVLTRRVA